MRVGKDEHKGGQVSSFLRTLGGFSAVKLASFSLAAVAASVLVSHSVLWMDNQCSILSGPALISSHSNNCKIRLNHTHALSHTIPRMLFIFSC